MLYLRGRKVSVVWRMRFYRRTTVDCFLGICRIVKSWLVDVSVTYIDLMPESMECSISLLSEVCSYKRE